jgi:hypothetical protein
MYSRALTPIVCLRKHPFGSSNPSEQNLKNSNEILNIRKMYFFYHGNRPTIIRYESIQYFIHRCNINGPRFFSNALPETIFWKKHWGWLLHRAVHRRKFCWIFGGAIIIQCKITRRSFAPTLPSHTQVKLINIKNIDMFKLY